LVYAFLQEAIMNCTAHIYDVHLKRGKWYVDISSTDSYGVYNGPSASGQLKFFGKVLLEAFELPAAVQHILVDHGYTIG
jgi:hypothetical protein